MKLDILVFGAHPDDVELSCGGTILKHHSLGKKCGIIDLTRGELGTRGDAGTRKKEAAAAARILGVAVRENLNFADGFFSHDKKHLLHIVKKIRQYRPEIVITPAKADRHPDHGRAARLISEACFYSGLRKIETAKLPAWRPKAVYSYIQDRFLEPDVITDISGFMDKKVVAIMAFTTQFFNPASSEPETPISSPFYLEAIKARNSELGKHIGVHYAEGFLAERPIGAASLLDLL